MGTHTTLVKAAMAVAGTVTHEGPVPIQVSYIVTAVLGCTFDAHWHPRGLIRTGILDLMRTGIRHIFSKCESMVDARHTKVRITHQCVLSTLCSVVACQRSIVDPSPSSGSTSVGRFNRHHLALGLFHSPCSVITSRQYLFNIRHFLSMFHQNLLLFF